MIRVAAITTDCPPSECYLCCGHGCLYFRNISGCEISDKEEGGLWLPRQPSMKRCRRGFHQGMTCVSCVQDPDGWRSEHAQQPSILVSGNCYHEDVSEATTVRWGQPVNLTGRLSGKSIVEGVCPLVNAKDNAIIDNVTFHCVNRGAAAVNVEGKDVRISGYALDGVLVRAASFTGVDVSNLSVTGSTSSPEFPVAILGHTKGDYKITCTDSRDVFSQPLDGAGTYGNLCSVVDVSQLLGVFGRHYEIEYFNKNAFSTQDQGWLGALVVTAVVGLLMLLSAHQDVVSLVRTRRSIQS